MLRRILMVGGLLCGPAVLGAQTSPSDVREDASHVSGEWGKIVFCVRADVHASLCGSDGDRCPVQCNATGALRVEFTNTSLAVTAASLPLPTGASTSANQTTVIGHLDGVEASLTSIDGKVLTDTQLRATPVPVSGTVTASGPLTDTQLRATPVTVSGTVTASGPLTDAELRATAVPVSGTVTASGPLTDTQLRASAVPVTANAGTNLNTSALALEAGGNLAGAATSLAVIDDWDESDRAKVNPIVGQAGVAANSGDASASTQRVVTAQNLVTTANVDGACVSVTGSTTVLSSFSTRKWASIVNQGTVTVYIRFGATATTSDFPLPAGAAFNWPSGLSYTGVVDAIAASGTQSVCVVEF